MMQWLPATFAMWDLMVVVPTPKSGTTGLAPMPAGATVCVRQTQPVMSLMGNPCYETAPLAGGIMDPIFCPEMW